MSYVKAKAELLLYDYPKSCFYCGKDLKIPFVHWMGEGEGNGKKIMGMNCSPALDIAFHPRCVGILFNKLLKDVQRVQGGSNG